MSDSRAGGSVGELYIRCYKGNGNNKTRERTQSGAIDSCINSSLAEEVKNCPFTLIQDVRSDH